MHKIHKKYIHLASYYVILYGTMTFSILCLSQTTLLILTPLYFFGTILLLKLFLPNKLKSKKIHQYFLVLGKSFVFTFLIFLPILHFLLFESYLGGQAFKLDWDSFLVSGTLVLLPSLLVGIVGLLINSVYILILSLLKKT